MLTVALSKFLIFSKFLLYIYWKVFSPQKIFLCCEKSHIQAIHTYSNTVHHSYQNLLAFSHKCEQDCVKIFICLKKTRSFCFLFGTFCEWINISRPRGIWHSGRLAPGEMNLSFFDSFSSSLRSYCSGTNTHGQFTTGHNCHWDVSR